MYPMANLLFAAPADLVLFKTRHSQKPIRILTYAAASFWVGLEIHQSIAISGMSTSEAVGNGCAAAQ